MTFVELDESEGFILLGRRREKDFLSTWALIEDQQRHNCIDQPGPPLFEFGARARGICHFARAGASLLYLVSL